MYRPIKVRYPENHPFFQDADLLYAKTMKNSSIGFYDTLIGKNQLKKNKFVSKFPCGVNGCKVHFISVEKYMMHYEAAHRFACSICIDDMCVLYVHILFLIVLRAVRY